MVKKCLSKMAFKLKNRDRSDAIYLFGDSIDFKAVPVRIKHYGFWIFLHLSKNALICMFSFSL